MNKLKTGDWVFTKNSDLGVVVEVGKNFFIIYNNVNENKYPYSDIEEVHKNEKA